ncbi:MAG: hypothetical protein QNK37_04345 [Acidobacteriota bacterium]|nr:hypothetical protein [Acidobacteriota bacterium]
MSNDLLYQKILETLIDLDTRDNLPREQRLEQALNFLMLEIENSRSGPMNT